MIVRRCQNPDSFALSAFTKLTKMGNITDLTVSERVNRDPVCRKLTKDLYYLITTGEVKEYDHIQNRAQSGDSLRKTFQHIRELINTNVTDCTHVRWVTLTYRENMMDSKQLYKDFEKFWKRFLYFCEKSGYEQPQYISVIEPQGRGAWHVHALFLWETRAPFIPNATLAELWRHGFVNIRQPKNCDNLGAYFSGYLADMPEEELMMLGDREQTEARAMAAAGGNTEAVEKLDADGKSKKVLKGARMALYPPGINIYRHSRGIKKPTVIDTTYGRAKEALSGSRKTYSRGFEILDENGNVVNRIWKASFNSVRRADEDENPK